jgi:hypothetical protein
MNSQIGPSASDNFFMYFISQSYFHDSTKIPMIMIVELTNYLK